MVERSRLSRVGFCTGAAAAVAATAGAVAPGGAEGARSGPWCRALTKAATDNIYDFTLDLLDGGEKKFTLSALEGRPVWLNFFATWCGPCNEEMPNISRIADKWGDKLHMIGIDVNEEVGPVREFRKRHGITFPIALDVDAIVFKTFKLYGYPTHMFLDANGVISCISVGDLTPDQMDNEVAVAFAHANTYPQAVGPAAATSALPASAATPSGSPPPNL